MSNAWMMVNNELEITWEEAVVAEFNTHTGISFAGTGKLRNPSK
jgi:hypothetical protein